jgi:YHS domain-containing protein
MERAMVQVKDPVCGMMIDRDTAADKSLYQGRTFYFCSVECKRQFDAAPERYAAGASSTADQVDTLERHEPPFTKTGNMLAPKFGSAGSGGLENEPGLDVD